MNFLFLVREELHYWSARTEFVYWISYLVYRETRDTRYKIPNTNPRLFFTERSILRSPASLQGSDFIISASLMRAERGVKSLRIPRIARRQREVFPADCPHPVPCGVGDTRMFQHMATFYTDLNGSLVRQRRTGAFATV